MTKTTIFIMGYAIEVKYTIHYPSYVEWQLVASKTWEDEHDVLNTLLRMHYSNFIESVIREHACIEAYAESLGQGKDIFGNPF